MYFPCHPPPPKLSLIYFEIKSNKQIFFETPGKSARLRSVPLPLDHAQERFGTGSVSGAAGKGRTMLVHRPQEALSGS